jgi:L-alanine-DL-glutamate epimerase-like enolase superfamily enzyme
MSAARDASTLAQPTGTKVALSTDHGTDSMGVQAGLALPDVVYAECCYHRLFELSTTPYNVRDGRAYPVDTPGHGVAFDDNVLDEYSR